MGDAGKILIRGLVIIAAVGLLAMGCSAGGTALKENPAKGLAKVQGIDVAEAEGATAVRLSLDRPVTFTSVKISEPPMMVVDLAGVELGDNTERIEVGKDPVLYINPSRDEGSKRIARLEIGLTRPASSVIAQDGSVISILFEKTEAEVVASQLDVPLKAPSSEDAAAVSADGAVSSVNDAPVVKASAGNVPDNGEAAVADAAVEGAGSASSETAAPNAESMAEATTVQGISFDRAGKTLSVVVDGDGRFAEPKVFMVGDDRLVLDIFGVGSVKDKDVIKVGGECVRQIRMAKHVSPDEKVRVVLDLASEVDYDVKTQGGKLVVAVAPHGTNVVAAVIPVADPAAEGGVSGEARAESAKSAAAAAPAAKVETAMSTGRKVTVSVPPAIDDMKETPKIYVTQKDGKTILSSAPEGVSAVTPSQVAGSNDYVVTETKVYTGGKISFDIQDAGLDKVIKLLADVAGLNLIVNPADVKGKVTLKLANVPWDQALDILLKIYKLDKVIEGNVLRVAPKKRLDEEKKIDLRAIAEQKKLMEEAEDLYTKTFKINYADAPGMEGKVKKMLTKRGDATSNPRTNELIVTDVKDKIEEAGQLIAILDKPVNQILIEARIITVDIGYTQSLGLSWGLSKNPDPSLNRPATFGVSGSNSSAMFNDTADQYELAVPSTLGSQVAGLFTGMTWVGLADDINLDLTIQALETIDKAETLAAPKVMTLENKSAQITSGTTLYVQTTSASGTRPEPLNANLSLTVTPRVTGDNYITMEVNATNNTASSPPPGSTAAIETKAVNTNVVVKDGDTIVLGGIYVKIQSNIDSQVPWLGRLPVIGWLFKERVTDESTAELLIFITPKIVKQEAVRT